MADKAFNPLDLGPEEFAQFVGQLSIPQTNVVTTSDSPAAQGLAPATLNALADASRSLGQLRDDISESGKKLGIRPGVFLDTKTGAPAGVRFRLGLDENQINQFKLLSKLYPGNVQISEEGRFILRNQPVPGGGVEDVMVDPIGFESGDMAQIGSQAIPMVAGGIGAKLGLKGANALKWGPLGKVFAGVTGMAAAQETVGGIQDVGVRLYRDNDPNVTEIAKHRAKMALMDEVLGFAFAGTTKAVSKTIETALGLPQIPVGTTPTREAAKALKEQTGVKFPLTPAQESENRLLQRMESMSGERMGSGSALDRTRDAQSAAEDELRRVFLGLPRTLTDDEVAAALPRADVVGQEGLERLGTEALRLEGNVARAQRAVNVTGTAETQLKSGVTLASPINPTDVGRAARARAVGDFDTFHGTMGKRYDNFLAKPEVRDRIVSGNSLANAVRQIEKDLTPQAVKMKPGPILGPTGTPIPVAKVETLEAFVPSKVRSFLDELKGLSGAKVSVNDLKQIRTSVRNAVKEGIAIPGTDVTQLRRLEDAVDDAITTSLRGMKDPTLLSEWQGLTKDYAKGMQRFDRVGIREMLVKEGEAGSVGNTALAERIVGNSPAALDYYNDFKAFFGAASPEFQGMQAAARQRVIRGAVDDSTGFISGPSLRARLSDMRPEVAEELFGVNQQELHRIGEALSKAQGNLDTADLVRLGESKSLTAAKVLDLVAAERDRAIAFNNKLIRAAAKGTIDAEKIKPSEFVRYATQMDPKDAARVMGILSDRPELLQDIKQIAIENIWGLAQAGPVGKERVSSKLLEGIIGNPVQRETWRVILGNDTVNALESFIKVADPREVANTAFKTAGAIGAGMEAPRLFLRGEVGAIPEIASRFLVAFLYSGPMKRAVTNMLTSNDRSRLLNGVIASTPFIQNLHQRFGSEGSLAIMGALRDMIEPMQERALAIEGVIPTNFDPRTLPEKDYKRWLDRQLLQ